MYFLRHVKFFRRDATPKGQLGKGGGPLIKDFSPIVRPSGRSLRIFASAPLVHKMSIIKAYDSPPVKPHSIISLDYIWHEYCFNKK